jgi:hypothetical protein
MSGAFHNRVHRGGTIVHNTLEGALLTSGLLIGTILILLLLYLGVRLAAA